MAVLASGASAAALPALPASTSFAVLDRDGNSVACAVTMDNLFGTGRIAPGTGILLGGGARPDGRRCWRRRSPGTPNVRGFRAAVAGSGQEGAALAVAVGHDQRAAFGDARCRRRCRSPAAPT